MAETTNVAVATVGVVVVGQWAKGESLGIRTVIGGSVYVILLAGMEGISSDIAKKFSVLVLITALFIQAVPIFKSLGLLDTNSKGKPKRAARNGRQP